jgi:ferritin-like metal-binding protein YciE
MIFSYAVIKSKPFPMAQLINLRDLLKHEVLDLYSAEEQIIEALPKMVEKAGNTELKKALSNHLKVTEQQKNRLDEIKELMGEEQEGDGSEKKKGFFSKLFGGSGAEKCKGTEGLIKEGEKMMGEDMTPEVMDAAIIGAAQKIEHYEISGYGTAVAYARELGLSNVAGLLQQTLDEEYAADDSLTKLAVGKLNIEAENATRTSSGNGRSSIGRKGSVPGSSSSKSYSSKAGTSSKSGDKAKSNGLKRTSKGNSKVSTSKRSSPKGNASKNSTSSGNKSAGKSLSKLAGKISGKSSSKDSSKSGKSKSSKRR